jgi:hypothetical protein
MQVDEGPLVDFLIDSGLLTRSQLAALAPAEDKTLYQILGEQNIIAEDELQTCCRSRHRHHLCCPH